MQYVELGTHKIIDYFEIFRDVELGVPSVCNPTVSKHFLFSRVVEMI